MPCLLGLIALFIPRVVILLLAVFSNYLSRAYLTLVWPILGFFFMPLTTLAYAWARNTYDSVQGFGLAAVIVAAVLDLGIVGSSRRFGRKRRGCLF